MTIKYPFGHHASQTAAAATHPTIASTLSSAPSYIPFGLPICHPTAFSEEIPDTLMLVNPPTQDTVALGHPGRFSQPMSIPVLTKSQSSMFLEESDLQCQPNIISSSSSATLCNVDKEGCSTQSSVDFTDKCKDLPVRYSNSSKICKDILIATSYLPRDTSGSRRRLAAFHRQIQKQDLQNALLGKNTHRIPVPISCAAHTTYSQRLYQKFLAESPDPSLVSLYHVIHSDYTATTLNLHLLGVILYSYEIPELFQRQLFARCCELETEIYSKYPDTTHTSSTYKGETVSWSSIAHLWRITSWDKLDSNKRCFTLLKPLNREYLLQSDFEIAIADIIRGLPTFGFLISSQSFISRYAETVATRLFLDTPSGASHHMTFKEFSKLNFCSQIKQLRKCTTCLEPNVPKAFSYKDFYVIYRKFWELDVDHDMLICRADIQRFDNCTLSPLIVKRIFEWNQLRGLKKDPQNSVMGFREFVVFILFVTEKTTNAALLYWFRCLDTDNDGVLSFMELESFWQSQLRRVREQYSVMNFLSIVSDVLGLGKRTHVLLSDLKRNRDGAGIFLDLVFDSQRRLEFLRRTSDVNFRKRDEVWADIPVVVDTPNKSDFLGMPTETRWVKLLGWEKYSERCYRELMQLDLGNTHRDTKPEIITSITPLSTSTLASDRLKLAQLNLICNEVDQHDANAGLETQKDNTDTPKPSINGSCVLFRKDATENTSNDIVDIIDRTAAATPKHRYRIPMLETVSTEAVTHLLTPQHTMVASHEKTPQGMPASTTGTSASMTKLTMCVASFSIPSHTHTTEAIAGLSMPTNIAPVEHAMPLDAKTCVS
ncbi:hypothetical protein BASA50_010649 [Batrachochytrium salamandrivorans]|uniref:EF-hand domain-containing protein n=1 Tax=Batrachochytrium salamandrivorans TaxID=1357716 RepID=A0ABQ8EXV6_9FUNG|nr:hypothetical protein BASA62_004330 [Batrachochytrium salamandrivorans]KAH6588579.1 hypothetical protein BASA50_010649 [Batrachochytrium salamandrivorans]KAH6588846.1 hypothetical protein BASA61_005798 [Batrachochytrium salamandrivorans]KAH9271158.1 hypothetical protein BASA83_006702 [Batrachochytrium salamandrivorans]